MKANPLIVAWLLAQCCSLTPYAGAQSLTIDSFLTVEETAGEIAIEVRRSGALDSIVTVEYTTEDIDAEAGRDYVAQRGTLRFDSGEKSKLIHIPILDDGLVERDELFRVRLSNPSAAVNLPETQVLVSIMDNETPGSIDEDFNPAVSGFVSAVMPDGKLVITIPPNDSANEAPKLVRLNVDGSVDESFHPTFMPGEGVLWIAAYSADKLLVLKTEQVVPCDGCASLMRLSSDGTSDKSFNPPPQLRLINRLLPLVLPDGKIIVATLDAPGGLARLDSNGSLDAAFHAAPIGDSVAGLLLLSDQSLVLNVQESAADGSVRTRLFRLKPDGSSDTSFKAPFEFVEVRQLVAELDGKFYVSARILNASEEAERFVRLNSDGSLDASFSLVDDPLISINSFVVIGLESSGRIIGSSARGIVRLNRDGSWDRAYIAARAFSHDLQGFPPRALLLPDGRLLLWDDIINGLQSSGLVRVDPAKVNRTSFRVEAPDCALCPPNFQISESAGQALIGIRRLGDTTGPTVVRFSTKPLTAAENTDYKPVDTVVTFESLEAIKSMSVPIIPDYDSEPDETLEVLTNNDGRSYGPASRATVNIWDDDRIGSRDSRYEAPPGYQLIGMQSDGKLLVAQRESGADANNNYTNAVTISRLDLAGKIDPTWHEMKFSSRGAVEGIGKIALLSDGKTYFTIGTGLNLVRLNSDGTLDSSFLPKIEPSPVSVTLGPQIIQDVSVQPDGTVLVAVLSEPTPTGLGSVYHIVRLKGDGSMDPGFAPLKVIAEDLSMFPAPAGKVWLAGFFFSVNDTPRRAIVRLNPDGSVDQTFSLPLGATNVSDVVYSQLKLNDGSFLFGGSFQFTNETQQRFLIHLSADGKFDPTFAPQVSGSFPYIAALAQQPDGKILLGGGFEALNGAPRTSLARLNLDGSLDVTFDAGQQAFFGAERIFLQPDGQIIVDQSGSWQRFNGDKRAALIAQPSGGGRFQAEAISYSAQTLVIEATENLLLPDWRPISTNRVTATTPLKFTDPDELKFPQRFYRAVGR